MTNIKNPILFAVPALIWGSTWFVIKFQLGVVNPLVSVAYRSAFAGVLTLLGCIILKVNLKFTWKQHFFILLQGLSLFGLNYWMVYTAETILTSGLVSIIFSLVIFMNIGFSALFLKIKVKKDVLFGAILGVTGTAFIFKNELSVFSLSDKNFFAFVVCLISMTLASLGNIVSARNQKSNIPIIQTNAFGMIYGGTALLIIAIISGTEIKMDFSFNYIASLAYLAIFGSIIAFAAYLKLLGNVGPDRSAYTILVVPIIAMIISTIFEGYIWQKSAIFGIILLLTGNLIAMGKKLKIKRITP